MIELNREKMARAIKRAKALRPRVLWLGGRRFAVYSARSGRAYIVIFAVDGDRKMGGCECKAGEHGLLCYHVAAAAAVNIAVQSERRRLGAAARPDRLSSESNSGLKILKILKFERSDDDR